MDGRTDKISRVFYRTLLTIWNSGKKRKAGQGYCWPYIDLGRLLVMQSLAMPRWQFRYITSFSAGLMKTLTVACIPNSICIVFFRIFGSRTFCNRYRSCLLSKLRFCLFYLYSISKHRFGSLLLFLVLVLMPTLLFPNKGADIVCERACSASILILIFDIPHTRDILPMIDIPPNRTISRVVSRY